MSAMDAAHMVSSIGLGAIVLMLALGLALFVWSRRRD